MDRFRVLFSLAIERAQKCINLFAVIAFFHHCLQDFDRFLRFLFAIQEICGLDARVDVKLAFFRNALESFQRFIIGLHFDIGGAEVVARAIVIRITCQDEIEFRRRPIEIALFKGDQANFNPRFAGIDFASLQGLELTQGFIKFVLADVKLTQTAARPGVLRVDLQKPLVGLHRVLGFAFKFVDESEVQ